MKIKIEDRTAFFIILMIILSKNMLGLVYGEWEILSFSVSRIFSFIIIGYLLFNYIKYLKYDVRGMFSIYIILIICSVFLSSYRSTHTMFQSFGDGLRPQINYIVALCSYFPLKKIMKLDNVNVEKLLDYLMYLGTGSSLLYIFQKLVYIVGGPKFIYFGVGTSSFGTQKYRLYVGSTIIILGLLISVYKYLKENKFKYIPHILIGIFVQLWVTQSRAEIMATLIAILVGFILLNKINLRGIVLYIFIIGISFYISTTSLFQNIVDNLLGVSNKGATLLIRQEGRELYFKQLHESVKNFTLGIGYPNIKNYIAYKKIGMDKFYFLNDNGIYAYFYIFGLFGLLPLATLYFKYIYLSIKCYFKDRFVVPLMYIVYSIVVMPNIILWYWDFDSAFILIIMLLIVENNLQNNTNNQSLSFEN